MQFGGFLMAEKGANRCVSQIRKGTQPEVSTRRRFLFVHNPIAGLNGRHLAREVTAGLTHLGASVINHDGAPEALPAVLREHAADIDAVVAVGGDGTIRALAAELEPYGLPLGVVPMGTGNVLAHEIGLPGSAVGLAHLLLRGPVHTFDGARANSEPFFLMAGIGFDGEVISRLDTPLKRRVGKLAYASPILETLKAPRPLLEIEVDGKPHQAHWLVAANAHRYGGSFVISRDAGIDRPGLIAVMMTCASNVTLVRQLLALATGGLHRANGVISIPCKSVSVRSSKPVSSQVDGDPFMDTPLTITAGGARVRLIVPEAYAASLAKIEVAA